MRIDDALLKSFLADGDRIPAAALLHAASEAAKRGKSLHEEILELGLMPEAELRKLEAYILGIPFVDLGREAIDPSVLHLIPEPIAKKSNVVAYRKSGRELEVAMLDPDDLQTIEFIKKTTNLKIRPRLTTPDSIASALRQYQKSLEAEFGEILRKEGEAIEIVGGEGDASAGAEDLKKLAEDLPIIKIVDTLMRHAILENASDIHIEPSEKEVTVRYRI